MRSNRALARQRAGAVTVGPAVVYDSPSLVEQIARLGFDWVWLDGQHGQFTEPSLAEALARFPDGASAPLVRVPGHDPATIGRVLDMGAMGVIVPLVNSAEDAAAAVAGTFYPPKGRRSAGGVRLGLLGESFDDYTANANDEIMLVVMVENARAIGEVEAVMAVPGVDAVLIGPGDLMLDLRSRGEGPEEHERLVEAVAAASKATGTAAGYVCGNDARLARRRIAQGFRFVNLGLDHFVIMDGFGALRDEARALSAAGPPA